MFKYLFKYKLDYIDDLSRQCHRALEHFGLKPDSTPPQLKDTSCIVDTIGLRMLISVEVFEQTKPSKYVLFICVDT